MLYFCLLFSTVACDPIHPFQIGRLSPLSPLSAVLPKYCRGSQSSDECRVVARRPRQRPTLAVGSRTLGPGQDAVQQFLCAKPSSPVTSFGLLTTVPIFLQFSVPASSHHLIAEAARPVRHRDQLIVGFVCLLARPGWPRGLRASMISE